MVRPYRTNDKVSTMQGRTAVAALSCPRIGMGHHAPVNGDYRRHSASLRA